MKQVRMSRSKAAAMKYLAALTVSVLVVLQLAVPVLADIPIVSKVTCKVTDYGCKTLNVEAKLNIIATPEKYGFQYKQPSSPFWQEAESSDDLGDRMFDKRISNLLPGKPYVIRSYYFIHADDPESERVVSPEVEVVMHHEPEIAIYVQSAKVNSVVLLFDITAEYPISIWYSLEVAGDSESSWDPYRATMIKDYTGSDLFTRELTELTSDTPYNIMFELHSIEWAHDFITTLSFRTIKAPTPTLSPTSKPTPKPTLTPSPTPKLTPTTKATATAAPTPAPEPSTSPSATSAATPSATPAATPTAAPSPTESSETGTELTETTAANETSSAAGTETQGGTGTTPSEPAAADPVNSRSDTLLMIILGVIAVALVALLIVLVLDRLKKRA